MIYILRAGPYRLHLGRRTQIMGIVNMTPDSFSGDGCFVGTKSQGINKALAQAGRFVRQGADIIDIGGESSRPGAPRITAQEEIRRVIPAIQALAKKISIPISVDTYKPLVARYALDSGATIVNNIMACNPDKSLLRMVCRYNAAIVLMHMRGTPQTMQRHIHYQNLIAEIIHFLKESIENCLEIGIKSDRIIIDPGIGFGKTVEHNLQIIRQLRRFEVLKRPILIGTSYKSFIGKVLHKDGIAGRQGGSLATIPACILNGAHIMRVHDVRLSGEVARMTDAIIHGATT